MAGRTRTPASSHPPSGRQAQARRNDAVILAAAREVFLGDARAPVSAVAEAAGVGISALYRRYPGKDDLLQRLCGDGLRRYLEVAREALAPGLDPWDSFAGFLTGIVESDVHALTVHLAGSFTATREVRDLTEEAHALAARILEQAQSAGAVRPDLAANDLAMLFEEISAVRVHDPGRTATLRRRYLALLLDALRSDAGTGTLPGPAPTDAEARERWAGS